jgi:hypothetical protein
MERLRHDVAWATTIRILQMFILSDQETCDAFPMVYQVIKDGLVAYEKETKDLLSRLRPLGR